jgi:hypothetical protein
MIPRFWRDAKGGSGQEPSEDLDHNLTKPLKQLLEDPIDPAGGLPQCGS